MAAVKEIRSIRQWSYETFGHQREVEFAVMATPDDLKVNVEYIRMADRYIEVPGGSNNNNYANVDLIVDHAVWAGCGHTSENPRFPESLAASKNKIVFIRPSGSAMRSLGDKISSTSTIVAQSAEVPTMPWSGIGITETVLSEARYVTVPDAANACVTSVEDGLVKAEHIGWPIVIKASEEEEKELGRLKVLTHSRMCILLLQEKLQVSSE
jgi:acetyl-CoA carboxylase/biotin carboxylase 1